jgi:DNA polymerase elongation subunit (family B)
MGARTSPIYKNTLAACTTAIGRERIYDAKNGIEGEWWNTASALNLGVCEAPQVIYGDTDSVFIKWSRKKKFDTGEIKTLVGTEALDYCIDCGKDAGTWITEHKLNKNFEADANVSKPQDLEYEKTFYPFILISKKRYVADKYEFDSKSCKRNSMGIVLKRRDNAPIVKHVFGNVIEKIMIDRDLHKSVAWLKETLQDIRLGTFPMDDFVITKSLRGYYKNPKGIAHKVLADRMGERDPGSKPKAGDRMPYAYIVLPKDKLVDNDNVYKSGPRKGQPRDRHVLQGDRIEDPAYIRKEGLALDYEFYITNQIMNPVKQVLDLEMDGQETELIFRK